jgi:hypothetical protein
VEIQKYKKIENRTYRWWWEGEGERGCDGESRGSRQGRDVGESVTAPAYSSGEVVAGVFCVRWQERLGEIP